MENNDDAERMLRHRNRRDVEWIPYHARRSSGRLCVTDDDGSEVKVAMEVAGLGTLTIAANARFSTILNQFKWDQSAVLKASIK